MANAVIPRKQGDDYQARFFWLQACRLFQPHAKVARIGFELDGVKAFDDVAVFYDPPITDEYRAPLAADYYQVKFHVDLNGAFTWRALMDPGFINATSVSLLQRLRDAVQALTLDGTGSRFHIVSPWPVHPDDELAPLLSGRNRELRFDRLFDGTTDHSKMGRLRKAFRDHLEIPDDEALRRILRPLRIRMQPDALDDLRERLNEKLMSVGLVPVADGCQTHAYDDLIWKLRGLGHTEFTRDQLLTICQSERLWQGHAAPPSQAVQVGIRSFLRWAEYMEDETDEMLCLLRHFNDRPIRDPRLWQEAIMPELSAFLSRVMRTQRPYHLHLDAHSSIAFAAGYCLDAKSGVNVATVQRTRTGRLLWSASPDPAGLPLPLWSLKEVALHPGGSDVALAVSVTADLLTDVQAYAARALPAVGRVLSFSITPQPCPTAVRDGTHALLLAQELVARVRQERTPAERRGILHIFAAAPNGLLFFLGQLGRTFGACNLYEYGFEDNAAAGYELSLAFPPAGGCAPPRPVKGSGGE